MDFLQVWRNTSTYVKEINDDSQNLVCSISVLLANWLVAMKASGALIVSLILIVSAVEQQHNIDQVHMGENHGLWDHGSWTLYWCHR